MKKLIVCSFAVFTMLYALCPMRSFPGVPGKLNYQGKLTDNQGDLITGTKDINFALYTNAVSAFAVWTESHATITVTNGLFNVMLGETNNLSSAFGTYDSLYLEIEVGGETLSPRQEMASAGYALKAQSTYKETGYPMETYVVKAGGTPGVDCDFTTLSEAVAAVGGSNGSIFVKNGTYIENIILNGLQNMIIQGESHDAVIQNSGASNTITLQGECVNVVIRDLRIEIGNAGYSAIYIESGDCSKIEISGCEIISTSSGIAYGIGVADGLSSSKVVNNYLESTSPLHSGNGVNGNFWYSLFQGNKLINWEKGFCFIGGSRNIVSSNYINSSGGSGTLGFSLQTCSTGYMTILGNEIIGPETGIALVASSNNFISGNCLQGMTQYGVVLNPAYNENAIIGNKITTANNSDIVGIYLYDDGFGGNNEISSNHLRVDGENNKGIYVGCKYSAVLANNIYAPQPGAIAIEIDSDKNTVSANRNFCWEPPTSTGNCLKETSGYGNVYAANWDNDTS